MRGHSGLFSLALAGVLLFFSTSSSQGAKPPSGQYEEQSNQRLHGGRPIAAIDSSKAHIVQIAYENDDTLQAPIEIYEDNKENLETRRKAALQIGELGAKAERAVPILIRHLADPSIRGFTIAALGDIGPSAKDAVGPLTKFFEKEDYWEWHAAITALRKIGPSAKSAAPAIIKSFRKKLNEGHSGEQRPQFKITFKQYAVSDLDSIVQALLAFKIEAGVEDELYTYIQSGYNEIEEGEHEVPWDKPPPPFGRVGAWKEGCQLLARMSTRAAKAKLIRLSVCNDNEIAEYAKELLHPVKPRKEAGDLPVGRRPADEGNSGSDAVPSDNQERGPNPTATDGQNGAGEELAGLYGERDQLRDQIEEARASLARLQARFNGALMLGDPDSANSMRGELDVMRREL